MRQKSGGCPAHAQPYFLLFTREFSLSHIDCPGDNTHFLGAHILGQNPTKSAHPHTPGILVILTYLSSKMSKCNVFLGGHSFVVSLQDHLEHLYTTSSSHDIFTAFVTNELKVSSFVNEIYFHGKRGGKITQDYQYPAHLAPSKNFQIGILDIGSNDAIMAHISVDDIVYHIFAEAEAMRDLYHIPVIKICSVVNRDYAGDLTAEQFTSKASDINMAIKDGCQSRPGIYYHGHEGFWRTSSGEKMNTEGFSLDGLHPNGPLGRKKYKASITKAIHDGRRALRALRQPS